MMNPASRELLGNDRSTSETGHRSDEVPTSTEASPSDGFLSPKTGTIPQPVQCSTFPQVGWPAAVSWRA